MAKEIEKKYLVSSMEWLNGESETIRQGYLSTDPERTVRVRRNQTQGYITVKGPTVGISRVEYEYLIPLSDADQMLDVLCLDHIIEKRRYRVFVQGKLWEVDVFEGLNEGLILAEIELQSEDEMFTEPAWIGEEVSGLPEYYNSQLSRKPYKYW